METVTAPKLAPARDRVAPIGQTLKTLYPEEFDGLTYESPLQLLIATILSAQCTDARVNLTTPALFAKYADAAAFAAAPQEEQRRDDPLDRLLPEQGEVDPRVLRRSREAPRRRGEDRKSKRLNSSH